MYIAGQRVAVQLDPPYDKWKLGYIHNPTEVSVVFDGHKGKATPIHPRISLLTVFNLETAKEDLRRIQLHEIPGPWHDFIISKKPALAKSLGDGFLSGVWWYFNFTCFGSKLPWLPVVKTAQLKHNLAIYKSNAALTQESIKISVTASFNIYGIYATIGHEIIHQWQKHNFFKGSKNTEPNKGHGHTFYEGMHIVMAHTPFKIEPTGDLEDEEEHFNTIENREKSKSIFYIILYKKDSNLVYGWYSIDIIDTGTMFKMWQSEYRVECYASKDWAPSKRIKKGRGRRKFAGYVILPTTIAHIKEFGTPVRLDELDPHHSKEVSPEEFFKGST